MRILMAICALTLSAAAVFGQGPASKNDKVKKDAAITAVAGESWIHHLHRSFDETSMGKTWVLGPPDAARDQLAPRLQLASQSGSVSSSSRTKTLHGFDLYRLNCQGCHGESGLGAPPEIGSVIDPVRATSEALVAERMKKVGMTMSRREAGEMAKQSRDALLKRLHEGGQNMPSFHQLSETEIRSLVAYLKQLAGVPGAEKEQIAIQESNARIGELIVKFTCHTCHGATGTNPTPAELGDGAIPPLSSLPERVNQAQLVRKVTRGAPVVIGTESLVSRGRMPVFNYLTEDEAADVYGYLKLYPPTEVAEAGQTPQPLQGGQVSSPVSPRGAITTVPQSPSRQVPTSSELTESVIFPGSVGLLSVILIAILCAVTFYEFKRLSLKSQARAALRLRQVESSAAVDQTSSDSRTARGPLRDCLARPGRQIRRQVPTI